MEYEYDSTIVRYYLAGSRKRRTHRARSVLYPTSSGSRRPNELPRETQLRSLRISRNSQEIISQDGYVSVSVGEMPRAAVPRGALPSGLLVMCGSAKSARIVGAVVHARAGCGFMLHETRTAPESGRGTGGKRAQSPFTFSRIASRPRITRA